MIFARVLGRGGGVEMMIDAEFRVPSALPGVTFPGTGMITDIVYVPVTAEVREYVITPRLYVLRGNVVWWLPADGGAPTMVVDGQATGTTCIAQIANKDTQKLPSLLLVCTCVCVCTLISPKSNFCHGRMGGFYSTPFHAWFLFICFSSCFSLVPYQRMGDVL